MTPPVECDNCARSRAGLWCGYLASCQSCTARAIARSLPAFNALHQRGTGERDPLRDAIRAAMPSTDATEARRMVWGWWQNDHAPRARVCETELRKP